MTQRQLWGYEPNPNFFPEGSQKYFLNLYLLSANTALSILLCLVVIMILVLLLSPKKQERKKFNRLSLLPYYFVICFGVLSAAQFTTTTLCNNQILLGALININKINFLYLALGVQIYEWFNAWLILEF
jgi:uncharacterized protein YqhQ